MQSYFILKNRTDMKKIIVTIFMLTGILLTVNSQEEEGLGFSAGDKNLEVNLRPAHDFPVQMNYLKGRYFIDSNMAVRGGLEFDLASSTDEGDNWESTERVIDLGLYPGIEMHFPISERLTPYFGGELGFLTRATRSYEENGVDREVKNANGFNRIELNAVGGFDFYVYKGLYLGVEVSYGFTRQSFKDRETTVNGTTTTDENNEVNYFLGDGVNTGIRLGWAF